MCSKVLSPCLRVFLLSWLNVKEPIVSNLIYSMLIKMVVKSSLKFCVKTLGLFSRSYQKMAKNDILIL